MRVRRSHRSSFRVRAMVRVRVRVGLEKPHLVDEGQQDDRLPRELLAW